MFHEKNLLYTDRDTGYQKSGEYVVLSFFSFGPHRHSITRAYFMNLGRSCEVCVEMGQATRWHTEVLWREYPIACEPRLKWFCQSDL